MYLCSILRITVNITMLISIKKFQHKVGHVSLQKDMRQGLSLKMDNINYHLLLRKSYGKLSSLVKTIMPALKG